MTLSAAESEQSPSSATGVETTLDELKTHQRGPHVVLRSHVPDPGSGVSGGAQIHLIRTPQWMSGGVAVAAPNGGS